MGRSLVIGLDAEAPRQFASFAFTSAHGPRVIGVVSSGIGPTKAMLIDGGRIAIVGHDCTVTWIDVESLAMVASRTIQWSFADLIAVDRDDHVLVIHELGALRADASGTVLWSFETPDVVEDFVVDAHGNLILSAMDNTRHTIAIRTGSAIESARSS